MRVLVWLLLWLTAGARAPAVQPSVETIQVIPFNYQNDKRQLKTIAELQAEMDGLVSFTANAYYGQRSLSVHVWPYVTIPYNAPTSQANCSVNLGFAADSAARSAGYALGSGSPTNFLWYRSPLDNNGEVCSHQNASAGLYGVVIFQNAEYALWYSTLHGLRCCTWTEVFSNAAATAFVTLRDAPNAAINMHTPWRNYFAATGQGNGSWSVWQRMSVNAVTDANAVIHVASIPTSIQHFHIMPVDEQSGGVTAKRMLDLQPLGLWCEARFGTLRGDWQEGLNCFDSANYQLVDMPPMPPWASGQIPSMTSTNWALGVNTSYTDVTNLGRITLMSMSATDFDIVFDTGTGPPPPPNCTPTHPGTRVSTDGAKITDPSCVIWGLQSTPGYTFLGLTKNGVGQMWASAVCLGSDSKMYILDEYQRHWYVPKGDSYDYAGTDEPNSPAGCSSGAPPPPDTIPPVIDSVTSTTSATIQIASHDNVAVVRVEVWSGTTLVTTLQGASGTVTVALPIGAPNTVTLKAYDGAGNVTTSTVQVK